MFLVKKYTADFYFPSVSKKQRPPTNGLCAVDQWRPQTSLALCAICLGPQQHTHMSGDQVHARAHTHTHTHTHKQTQTHTYTHTHTHTYTHTHMSGDQVHTHTHTHTHTYTHTHTDTHV